MNLLKEGNSKHHLFSYYEIRAKLVQIYGEPKTPEEHVFIQRKTKKIKKLIPVFSIDLGFHRLIHKNDFRGVSRIFAQSND